MKIDKYDNKYIVYLNKNNKDFTNFNNSDDNFKSLFKILKKYYKIEITGLNKIKIFKDKYYGLIIEIDKENIDYYDYLEMDTIAMRISTYKTSFLYEVDDNLFIMNNLKRIKIYYDSRNKIYIKLLQELPKSAYLKLLEMSKIKYKDLDNLKEIKSYSK